MNTYALFKRTAIATHAVGSAIDLGLIDSVGDCLFKLLGPEVVGKPWPTMPVRLSSEPESIAEDLE